MAEMNYASCVHLSLFVRLPVYALFYSIQRKREITVVHYIVGRNFEKARL